MGKRIAIMLLLVGIVSTELFAHDFYISITSIRHYPETRKLTVQIKLFVNDLEESIFQEKGVRLGIWANNPLDNAETYVEQYVSSNFSISINDAPVSLKFTDLKVEPAEVLEDNVMIYKLEAYDVAEIASVKVRNSLLLNAFDSQANIVNITANDSRKVINLDRQVLEDEVVF